MKRCTACGEQKAPSAFYVSRRRPGELQSRCIACLKARKRGRSLVERRTDAVAGFVSRFWSYVDKEGPGGCWLWTGYVMATGYGGISIVGEHAMRTTHRVSWELHNGPIPDGLYVLHHCDVRRCVNPAHLHVGTQAENMRECADRNRWGNQFRRNQCDERC